MPQLPHGRPQRIVNSVAPIRICDVGGWTDTWFAGHGRIFNIGVSPHVEVQIAAYPRAAQPERIVVYAENYGERIVITDAPPMQQRHPLIAAALAEIPPPNDLAVAITIFSEAPAGCATGTSAAAVVALLGALDRLTPGRMTPHAIAYAAHRVETERLGLQSGVQDQLCAAYGGINYIEMTAYPQATVTQLQPPDDVWRELERRLLLIFLGAAHSSSALHEKVIAEMEREGAASPRLETLRQAAERSRDALAAGDFAALGRAMTENTAGQAALHPDLVGAEARSLIELARAHGALGWKVNGAGGAGGSLTILCDAWARDKRRLIAAIGEINPLFRAIPIRLSRSGLRVWEAYSSGQ